MIKPLPPHPAALLGTGKSRTLVIADLHLGWEMALSEKGIHVPSQTQKLLKRVLDLISMYKPGRLLILGDIKYSVAAADIGEWHDVPDFFTGLQKRLSDIVIIRGNHDGNLEPLLPENVKILPATGVSMGEVGFFHGHKWPTPALLGCKTLVMGHVHPVVAFRDRAGFRITRQVWVKIRYDSRKLSETLLTKNGIKIKENAEVTLWKRYRVKPKTSQLFIMPSFNDFLGGRPLNEAHYEGKSGGIVGPVLRSGSAEMARAETYLLDGTFLGTLSQLKSLG